MEKQSRGERSLVNQSQCENSSSGEGGLCNGEGKKETRALPIISPFHIYEEFSKSVSSLRLHMTVAYISESISILSPTQEGQNTAFSKNPKKRQRMLLKLFCETMLSWKTKHPLSSFTPQSTQMTSRTSKDTGIFPCNKLTINSAAESSWVSPNLT